MEISPWSGKILTEGHPNEGLAEGEISTLRRKLEECEQRLEKTFEKAMADWTQARNAWTALFPALGPPDLSFIAQPHTASERALTLKPSGAMAAAILTLRQAEERYRTWTKEVEAFNERLRQAPPPKGKVIEGMDLVDKIAPGEPPAKPDKIITLRVAEDVEKDKK